MPLGGPSFLATSQGGVMQLINIELPVSLAKLPSKFSPMPLAIMDQVSSRVEVEQKIFNNNFNVDDDSENISVNDIPKPDVTDILCASF
jgi:hypothetical protein